MRLDGADITGMKANRRPVNLMFQSYALFPHMTVFGNVAYGLEMEGMRGAELAQRVQEALALVRMSDFAPRKPNQLSGGQKQRVALARALVKRPKVLLLDEPLGALDRKLREQMQIELKKLQQDTGIAFVVVTHDQEEALTLADRIALLDRGRIVQLATPRELYDRPVNRFAADFIGLMNFIDGVVKNGQRIRSARISARLPAPNGVKIGRDRHGAGDPAGAGAPDRDVPRLAQRCRARSKAPPSWDRTSIAHVAVKEPGRGRWWRGWRRGIPCRRSWRAARQVWLNWQADQAVMLEGLRPGRRVEWARRSYCFRKRPSARR